MTDLPFDSAALDKLADVIVGTGLNLQQGQELIVSAPIEALPLVRCVAASAYKAGATLVTPMFADDGMAIARYAHAQDEALDYAAAWLSEGMAKAFDNNAARLAISGANPMVLAGQDPARVSRAAKASAKAGKPAMEKITNFDINWCVAAYPTVGWAKVVFPDLSEAEAQAKLAEAVFAASRIGYADPVAEWARHNAELAARRDWLNEQRFDALHFRSAHTDLTVGLADGHLWAGGAADAKNGVTCNANIPTEEVFTTPHATRVNGTVRASKPLAHQGNVIENIEVTFKDGVITEARASASEDVFLNLLDTDEGARRLGEVALVPYASPISESGILFYNTLFDENAASHIALGQCYKECLEGAETATEEEIAARGGNASLIHVDWMIGAKDTDIDGLLPDGTRVPVFRGGNWA